MRRNAMKILIVDDQDDAGKTGISGVDSRHAGRGPQERFICS